MPDQDKKIMILYSLYLALGVFAVYKSLHFLGITIVHPDEYASSYYISIVLFLIAGIILIIASYGLLKHKIKAEFIGLVGSIFLLVALFYLLYFTLAIRNLVIAGQINNILVIVVSAIALVLTIIYCYKDTGMKDIIKKPLFQDKKIMILYSLYLVLGSIAVYNFLDGVAAIFYPNDYHIFYYVTVFLFLIAGVLLIYVSYGLLKNKADAKFIGFSGIIFLWITLFYCFFVLMFGYGLPIIRQMNDIFLTVISVLAFILTITNWKKLP